MRCTHFSESPLLSLLLPSCLLLALSHPRLRAEGVWGSLPAVASALSCPVVFVAGPSFKNPPPLRVCEWTPDATPSVASRHAGLPATCVSEMLGMDSGDPPAPEGGRALHREHRPPPLTGQTGHQEHSPGGDAARTTLQTPVRCLARPAWAMAAVTPAPGGQGGHAKHLDHGKQLPGPPSDARAVC